jgi:hypothetical protein
MCTPTPKTPVDPLGINPTSPGGSLDPLAPREGKKWSDIMSLVAGPAAPVSGSQTPQLPAQPAVQADQQAMRRALQSLAVGVMGTRGGTQLTGPRGVNPAFLNIGRNTLLGS